MKVIEKYLDMAKRWRVKVQLDDGECIILKFQQNPEDNEVLTEVNKCLTNLNAQKAVISEEVEKAALVRDITLKELKTKLGVEDGIANTI